jgi:hypothetical protein
MTQMNKYTPENIEELKDNEIIVFGSNKNGWHGGGLARVCADKWGAKNGVSEGITGKCYAFPTLGKDMQKVSQEELEESVERLIACMDCNKDKTFILTKVGMGIANFSLEEIKPLFQFPCENIIKPIEFY